MSCLGLGVAANSVLVGADFVSAIFSRGLGLFRRSEDAANTQLVELRQAGAQEDPSA